MTDTVQDNSPESVDKMNAAKGAFNWYIVRVKGGREKSTRLAMQEVIEREGKATYFGEILVPSEEVIDMHKGEKRQITRLLYPGYLIIQIKKEALDIQSLENPTESDAGEISTDIWHLVRSCKNVLGFVGSVKGKPIPLSPDEVDRMIASTQERSEALPTREVFFETGDSVRISEGPFEGFRGVIEEVNMSKERLKVGVTVFGRSTPVELGFSQVIRE